MSDTLKTVVSAIDEFASNYPEDAKFSITCNQILAKELLSIWYYTDKITVITVRPEIEGETYYVFRDSTYKARWTASDKYEIFGNIEDFTEYAMVYKNGLFYTSYWNLTEEEKKKVVFTESEVR